MKAALRDASWYGSPGYAGKYHVSHGCIAACSDKVFLNDTTLRDAGTVPEHMRCQRPGCKARWPQQKT